MPAESQPLPAIVAKGTLHCGAGCMIGDVIAEWLAFAVPAVAVWLGWHTLFDEKMFAVWVLDFIFAFALGIAFQYFAIVPMRKLPRRQGIVAALKADTLSLAAWQVGMYGFMALRPVLLVQARVRDACRRRHARVLVHDADRDAGRVRHRLSGQLVAYPQRHQGEDVGRR